MTKANDLLAEIELYTSQVSLTPELKTSAQGLVRRLDSSLTECAPYTDVVAFHNTYDWLVQARKSLILKCITEKWAFDADQTLSGSQQVADRDDPVGVKKRGRLARGEVSDTSCIRNTRKAIKSTMEQIDVQVKKLMDLHQKYHDLTYEEDDACSDSHSNNDSRVHSPEEKENFVMLDENVLLAEDNLLKCYAERNKFKTEMGDTQPLDAPRFTGFAALVDKVNKKPVFLSSGGTMKTAEEKSDFEFAMKVAMNRSAREPHIMQAKKKLKGSNKLAIKSETSKGDRYYFSL